jgi:hypothetical protein
MAKEFIWKIWLRKNTLTKNVDNDYIAEVSTTGHTLRNEDIARLIANERSELRYESMVSAFHERDAIVRNALLNGSSVMDGVMHIQPRIPGNWIGASPVYDPKHHRPTFDATPTTEFRKMLDEQVGVEILGTKTDGGAVIGLVTDVATGKVDGQITSRGDVIITGEKIKIAPDNDVSVGVFLVTPGGEEVRFNNPFAENNPKRLICRVPDIENGTYTLKIVTRYSNSNTLLKESRTIVYELPVTVES